MPLLRGGRPLKRWRYVGAFGDQLMLCAGFARVIGAGQAWWAVWQRDQGWLRERTVFARPARAVRFAPGRVTVRDGDCAIDLAVDEIAGVETVCPHGGGYVWTRKQAGVAMRGSLAVDGRVLELDGHGAIDETAGYHARRTSWRWSTGVGRTADGESVAWNLVEGVNDGATGSERAVWIGGEPFEPGPVRFAEDLSSIELSEGGRLEFHEWPGAVREDRTNLIVLRSYYRQPFGTFSGDLPGGLRVVDGYGVMESHHALW